MNIIKSGLIMMLFMLIIQNESLAQKKGKWVDLIQGNTLNGWHTWKMKDVKGWKVENGVLTTGGKNSDILTDKEYGDFELEFEFLVSPKGNSGVMYKVLEDVNNKDLFASYASAPEYQVIDDKDYPGINDKQKTGANYDMYPPSDLTVIKPVGKWNKGKIVVKENRIQHFLNGKKVVDYIYDSEEWRTTLEKSKFAKWAYATPHHKGKLAFQDHGDAISYRKIKIKEL
jgi:hypothetical protein